MSPISCKSDKPFRSLCFEEPENEYPYSKTVSFSYPFRQETMQNKLLLETTYNRRSPDVDTITCYTVIQMIEFFFFKEKIIKTINNPQVYLIFIFEYYIFK